MQIRLLETEENIKTRPLYETVFDEDSEGFVDYYYTEKTRDNQIYVVEEDGEIRAMLHLNPYRVAVNESVRAVNYIVAVATQEEYRSRGYMAALLRRALTDMKKAGQSFTFLMPAAEAIYTPHDFRTVYEYEKEFYKEQDSAHAEIVPVTDDMCEELAEAANCFLSSKYQIYAVRDAAYYKRLKKELESDGAKLMAYRRDGEIKDCRPWIPGELSERHKIMIRIVDVKRMLMAIKVKSLTAVCFTVTDPIVEDNNCCVVLTGTEFSGLMLMDGRLENSEGTMTIGALASFLFGAKTIDEICEEEGVQMTDRMKGELKKTIPLDKIYLQEIV